MTRDGCRMLVVRSMQMMMPMLYAVNDRAGAEEEQRLEEGVG